MDQPWKVIFAFVGVFVAGAIFGGVFTLRASHKGGSNQPAQVRPANPNAGRDGGARLRPNAITVQLMRTITRRINLTPDQKESVNKIVGRAGEDMARLSQQNFSDTSRVVERMYADVSALLSPEQRAELETMRRQAQEKLDAAAKKKVEAAAAEAQREKQQKANAGHGPGG